PRMRTATYEIAAPDGAAPGDTQGDIFTQDPAARAYAGARGGALAAAPVDTSAISDPSAAVKTTAAVDPSATSDSTRTAAESDVPENASRVYRGRTVEELIAKIQAELGRDAIVLRRESGLTGGFAGFFQRPYVEIEARRGSPGVDCYDEA